MPRVRFASNADAMPRRPRRVARGTRVLTVAALPVVLMLLDISTAFAGRFIKP
jgi:hypothetical protein